MGLSLPVLLFHLWCQDVNSFHALDFHVISHRMPSISSLRSSPTLSPCCSIYIIYNPFPLICTPLETVVRRRCWMLGDGVNRENHQQGSIEIIRSLVLFLSGWWFGTFVPIIWNNHPNWLNWLIFFRGVETTNQFYFHSVFFVLVHKDIPFIHPPKRVNFNVEAMAPPSHARDHKPLGLFGDIPTTSHLI